MDFQKLLQDKRILFGAIAVVAIIVFSICIFAFTHANSKEDAQSKIYKADNEKLKKDVPLLTTDNLGKIIEVEALLYRHHIKTTRVDGGGSKVQLVLDKDNQVKQRDQALLLIAQNGFIDGNVGLEVFDKSSFTDTKDDKRIKLARAVNGEISRLIRKIGNGRIENASVFVSIPENQLFTSQQKPITATVQIVLATGDKLSKSEVRAITNLLLGSISGLEAENISITDTNGNVYASLSKAGDDALDKIEENDDYMKRKVQLQLDKLLGKGNYVVTVSTYLRQAPTQRMSTIYDPDRNVILSEQEFNESLGDKNSESGQVSNAVSLYLPSGLPQVAATDQNRSYNRNAQERQYGTTKTQVEEYLKPGMIEDISIAVTIENNALPDMISLGELKELIAKAASPKVRSENVEIMFAKDVIPSLEPDKDIKMPKPEGSGNPWFAPLIILFAALIIGFMILSRRVNKAKEEQESKINDLKQLNAKQSDELKEVNQRAQMLLAQQNEIQQSLTTIRQPVQIPVANMEELVENVNETIEEEDDDEMAIQVKNWIEG